jgi:hypothetical protein
MNKKSLKTLKTLNRAEIEYELLINEAIEK